MDTPTGIKDSIPAWIKYSVQPPGEIPYNGVYYDPAEQVQTSIHYLLICFSVFVEMILTRQAVVIQELTLYLLFKL